MINPNTANHVFEDQQLRINAMRERAEAAERERDELAAHVEAVRTIYGQRGGGSGHEERSGRLVRVGKELNKSPVASLAAHDAALIRDIASKYQEYPSGYQYMMDRADAIERGEA